MVAKPTPKQLAWQDMELGVIIHWCMEIYNPDFKGYKTSEVLKAIPPEIIRPDRLDTDAWLRSASELGAGYAVLVANHCTGFSLWPTGESDYSVSSINWKDGKGDVVGDFIKSCRKYNIKPALYYSTGCNGSCNINDEIKHDYFAPYYRKYVEMVEKQVTELWTEYGELFEIWFDGGIIPAEKGGPRIFELLEKYQPDAITFQGPAGYKNNIRWVGNEDGVAPEDCFCACDISDDSPDGSGNINGQFYCPAESDFPNRNHNGFGGGWAWREGEEDTVISPEELFECYLRTVGRNTNMLIGMGISTSGEFTDGAQFKALGNIIKKEFSDKIECSISKNGNFYEIKNISRAHVRYVVIREKLENGQHICGYRLTADGKEIAFGRSIGHKRIFKADGTDAETFILEITDSLGDYEIRDINLYR